MEYLQSFYKSAGNYACYALCLINIAEEYLNVKISKDLSLEKGIELGYIYFNKKNYDDTENFYVKDPAKYLQFLTGAKWKVRKEGADYKRKTGEYAVEYWSYTNGRTGHFARIYKGFNSLQNSKSVKDGKIVSYRICEVA